MIEQLTFLIYIRHNQHLIMKKTILTLTLATAALFTSQAFAQTSDSNGCPAVPCGAVYNCNNAQCPYLQNPDSCMMNPFASLNLTADQQAKLKELRNKKFQQKTKDIKSRQELRQARRQACLQDIKSILTPEQYVQFLENNFVNGNGYGNAKAYKNGKGPRHHKGNRNNCPQQPCPGAPCQNAPQASK